MSQYRSQSPLDENPDLPESSMSVHENPDLLESSMSVHENPDSSAKLEHLEVQTAQDTKNLVNELKRELEEEAETGKAYFWGCLKDYLCCVVVREEHSGILILSKKALHVQQGALNNYLNDKAKCRLLWAISFLLVALFFLGAMNFMENLDDIFPVTNCKVNLNVINSEGSQVTENPFVIARLKNCPKHEMDHIDLQPNGYLEVKYVECHAWKTPIEKKSDCFNVFKCDKTSLVCNDLLFPST